jgi:hypothetical protein
LRAALGARKVARGRRVRRVLFRAIAMRGLVALHGVRRRIGRRVVMVMRVHRDGLTGSAQSGRRGSSTASGLNVRRASSTASAPNARHASLTVNALNARRASSTVSAPNAHRAVSQRVSEASERLVAKAPAALRAVLRATARRAALKASGQHASPATKAPAARHLAHRVALEAQTMPAAQPARAPAAASTPVRVENARDTTNVESRVNVARPSARALAQAAAVPTSAARSSGHRATKAHAEAHQVAAKVARLPVSAMFPSAASVLSPRPSSVRTEIAPNARRARIVEHEHLPHAGSAIGRHAQNIRSVRRAPANQRAPSAVKDPLRPRPPRIAAIATMRPARYGCRS